VETPTPLSTQSSTQSVIEALCDSQLRPAALAHASSSDIVIAAVVVARQLETSGSAKRTESAKTFADLIAACGSDNVAVSVMRPVCDAELPWHVIHQLFELTGIPYANGKYRTSQEVYAWMNTQPYGRALLAIAVQWELTRTMARFDLKRDLKVAAAAAPYVDDVAVLRTMLRWPGEGLANTALAKLAELLPSDELVDLLDEAFNVSDSVWKDACRRLEAADVRRWAYKSDLSFIRRYCALGMIPTEELLLRVADQSLESHVRTGIETTLAKRNESALVSH
jgi:hypothetical protein